MDTRHSLGLLRRAGATLAGAALLVGLGATTASAAPEADRTDATVQATCNYHWKVTANYAGFTAGYSWAWNVVIARGATGDRVREIQCLLNADPRYTGTPLTVDGVYGSTTAWAVDNFQWSVGLPEDGVVGPQTWRELRRGGEI